MAHFAQDPTFLRIYHSGDKEWPGYKVPDDQKASLPLLISEIYRLTPYIESEHVRFHPKNMPNVEIDKIEVIGIVTEKKQMTEYTSYTVDDSTGAITVLCTEKVVYEDQSTMSQSSSADEPSDLAEAKPEEPYDRHIRNLWHLARDEEHLCEEIALYDYVHVIGFCAMSFRNRKDVKELTDEDIELGILFLYAFNIRRITEAEHNTMMKGLIVDLAGKRYLGPNI